jgi:hypothetical protein
VHACSSVCCLSSIYFTASSRYFFKPAAWRAVYSCRCSIALLNFISSDIRRWSCTVVSAVSRHFFANVHRADFCSPTYPFSVWKCSHICSHPNATLRSNASCL